MILLIGSAISYFSGILPSINPYAIIGLALIGVFLTFFISYDNRSNDNSRTLQGNPRGSTPWLMFFRKLKFTFNKFGFFILFCIGIWCLSSIWDGDWVGLVSLGAVVPAIRRSVINDGVPNEVQLPGLQLLRSGEDVLEFPWFLLTHSFFFPGVSSHNSPISVDATASIYPFNYSLLPVSSHSHPPLSIPPDAFGSQFFATLASGTVQVTPPLGISGHEHMAVKGHVTIHGLFEHNAADDRRVTIRFGRGPSRLTQGSLGRSFLSGFNYYLNGDSFAVRNHYALNDYFIAPPMTSLGTISFTLGPTGLKHVLADVTFLGGDFKMGLPVSFEDTTSGVRFSITLPLAFQDLLVLAHVPDTSCTLKMVATTSDVSFIKGGHIIDINGIERPELVSSLTWAARHGGFKFISAPDE
jgi:hypothetical protein